MKTMLINESDDRISEVIYDLKEALIESIPALDDDSYCCARFINKWGKTFFNPLQAETLLVEWERLKPKFEAFDSLEEWAEIRALIVRCGSEPGALLEFDGD